MITFVKSMFMIGTQRLKNSFEFNFKLKIKMRVMKLTQYLKLVIKILYLQNMIKIFGKIRISSLDI